MDIGTDVPVATVEPRDLEVDQIIDVGQSLLMQGEVLFNSLFRTWNLYQIGIAIGLFALAHVLRAIFGPRIRE